MMMIKVVTTTTVAINCSYDNNDDNDTRSQISRIFT